MICVTIPSFSFWNQINYSLSFVFLCHMYSRKRDKHYSYLPSIYHEIYLIGIFCGLRASGTFLNKETLKIPSSNLASFTSTCSASLKVLRKFLSAMPLCKYSISSPSRTFDVPEILSVPSSNSISISAFLNPATARVIS